MQDLAFGTAYVATATGAVCVTSANARVIGVCFQGTGTCGIRLWAGVTATATSNGAPLSGVIRARATATSNEAMYVAFPAYASGGLTILVQPSLDPSLTLFWSPTGG